MSFWVTWVVTPGMVAWGGSDGIEGRSVDSVNCSSPKLSDRDLPAGHFLVVRRRDQRLSTLAERPTRGSADGSRRPTATSTFCVRMTCSFVDISGTSPGRAPDGGAVAPAVVPR